MDRLTNNELVDGVVNGVIDGLKVIHVQHDLRKMFITLVWND